MRLVKTVLKNKKSIYLDMRFDFEEVGPLTFFLCYIKGKLPMQRNEFSFYT